MRLPDPPDAAPGGPLAGLRVVEFAGMGPAPFACMLLADMGAEVATITRPDTPATDPRQIAGRGRLVVRADLKLPDARDRVLALLDTADVLVEGFRPGVMERLGLGPDAVAARNPRLVYGRMTGWGQHGPLAQAAGHDINYIALSGALHAIGPAGGPPVVPLNLVGDYGGGSLYLVTGILAALHEVRRSGRGQVVDAAITDGVLSLMSQCLSGALKGTYIERRGVNLLDGSAPHYGVYATADGGYMGVGPLEAPFFAQLCERLGVDPALRDARDDPSRWPALRAELAACFARKTRDEWARLFAGSDACVTPVLSLTEAAAHPHHLARRAFVDVGGIRQPAPAPRFSRTSSAPRPAQDTEIEALMERWLLERHDNSLAGPVV
ncbi:CoA transferase [Pigmentiphaga sp. GD03639]|uniref:CaiB/BaiF CoA transferase family protein n=1 Tax=Pigmentiphaga sp. GD03639 TaxID=2975354 RepID=UPI0024494533|nr:CaiB/BaiF CoA-transferase family protein [Pigmentiphaga sp. GD03639]MDH2239915.1 CoA transferase [Pigmentiphaga sp. GD03639]